MVEKMKSVLIFGIGGFVGRYVAKEFHENGYNIYGSDIACSPSLPGWIDFQAADLLNMDAVSELIAKTKPDIIINLAAISSVWVSWNMPQTTMQVNVIGALNILEAIRTLDIGIKVLFIGSSEEYQAVDHPIDEQVPLNANNPYGISKMAQAKFCDTYRSKYGMKIYYVRPFNHTGVGQSESFVLPSFCKQVAQIEMSGKPGIIKVGNLSVARDFCDVRDVTRAYRMIVESDKCANTYNVGSGTAYPLIDLLTFIVSLSTKSIDIQVDPERFRPAENQIIQCDNRYIKRELGWEPRIDLYDTLRDMYAYYCRAT